MALQLLNSFRKQPKKSAGLPPTVNEPEFIPAAPVTLADDDFLRMMQAGRYGFLAAEPAAWLRHPQFSEVCKAAVAAIDDRFSMVPEGYASICVSINDEPGCEEIDHLIEPFMLARTCVTNAEFQMFVDCGGYSDLELWDEEIWPHLIDFKDQTAQSGPRWWKNGRHDSNKSDHPVVGVCFFEAAAYARWAGYRLAAEPEWQMAASWRIRSAAHVSRRYPWGDALDVRHCNIWASGHGRTQPVTASPGGAAPNGVMQLIGNVWEWTATDFDMKAEEGRPVVGDMLMKCIRGGAYDTYFPWQATAAFRTGAICLARSHNIGFRCALDAPKD